jgi:hypothetical protein
MEKYLIGALAVSLLINVLTILLLSRKKTTENNYQIESLKQKNKDIEGSNVDNDISARINTENPKKDKKKRFRRKNK